MEEVDAWLGIYFNKLKNQGIDDNTLVIFTSDHGGFDLSFQVSYKNNKSWALVVYALNSNLTLPFSITSLR